jgi:hypothetical protein
LTEKIYLSKAGALEGQYQFYLHLVAPWNLARIITVENGIENGVMTVNTASLFIAVRGKAVWHRSHQYSDTTLTLGKI